MDAGTAGAGAPLPAVIAIDGPTASGKGTIAQRQPSGTPRTRVARSSGIRMNAFHFWDGYGKHGTNKPAGD